MVQQFTVKSRLLLKQVEQKLEQWRSLPRRPPKGGWLRTIREALAMSTSQLSRRLGITRQGLADLERREQEGKVTLAALAKAAEALGCDLVYAIVPRSDLRTVLESQARARAFAEIRRAAHTMRLEAQDVPPEDTEHLIQERTIQLLSTRPHRLWDDPAAKNESRRKTQPAKSRARGTRKP